MADELPRLQYGGVMMRPSQSGYSAIEPFNATVTDISGGFARVARDTLSGVYAITAKYQLNELEYLWWGAFYHTTLLEGSLPFIAELALDTPNIQEYVCQIVKTPSSSKNLGFYKEITLTLQAEPIIDTAYNEAVSIALGTLGDDFWSAISCLEHATNEGAPLV